MRRFTRSATALVPFLVTLAVANGSAHAEPASIVFLNGAPTAVFFNDGDSFRVLQGNMTGMKARLSGYNTLESFGPVHQWGGWSPHELFVNAKMATLNARRGVWHCSSDMKTDTYGRTLWWCPDLAADQVRKGFAHAMSVTDAAGDATVIAAMKEAQAAKAGMWGKGIPDWIVTSIHSIEEDTEGHGTYNRMVSTEDGHSAKWRHDETYAECQKVCDDGGEDGPRIAGAIAALKAEPTLAGAWAHERPYSDDELTLLVNDFARGKSFAQRLRKGDDAGAFAKVLEGLKTEGKFGRVVKMPSCMVNVQFNRRFGGARAKCLQK